MADTASRVVWKLCEVSGTMPECENSVYTNYVYHRHHSMGALIVDPTKCVVVNEGNVARSLFFKHCDGVYKNALWQTMASTVAKPVLDEVAALHVEKPPWKKGHKSVWLDGKVSNPFQEVLFRWLGQVDLMSIHSGMGSCSAV